MEDNKRKSITVTFSKYDDDVYSFLKHERNASALIRHLVRNYMMGNGVQTTPQPVYVQPVYTQPVPQPVPQPVYTQPVEQKIVYSEPTIENPKEEEEKEENRNMIAHLDL